MQDFLNDPRGFTAHFTADPTATAFPVTGINPDRTAVMLGAAISAQLAPMWRMTIAYDAELRGSDVSHVGTAGLKVNW